LHRFPDAPAAVSLPLAAAFFFQGIPVTDRRRNPGAPRWILSVMNFLRDWSALVNRFKKRGKQ